MYVLLSLLASFPPCMKVFLCPVMEAAIYQKKTKINYKPILYVIPENSVLF
jgi:hypothetical protein